METLKTKTYYGEYSLSHWLNLILKKNIILPDYQRSFVWDKKDVTEFISDLEKGHYVPPVTIGLVSNEEKRDNLIIDGQQRLTSILLYALNLFPKKFEFIDTAVAYDSEEAEYSDEASGDTPKKPLDWNFKELTQFGANQESILQQIDSTKYETLLNGSQNKSQQDDFLKNHYIGFSYIIPEEQDVQKQSKFYSSVFRDINFRGKKLSAQESRKSLYFLDVKYKDFFNTDALADYTILQNSTKSRVDVIRYFSMLSEFHKAQSSNAIAKGFSYLSRREDYYVKYIHSIIEEEESRFTSFQEIFPNNDFDNKISILKQNLATSGITKNFSSIIDADYWLFGLIYVSLFLGKNISFTTKLKDEIEASIKNTEKSLNHRKAPNALKYVRERIANSIETYKQYAQ